GRVPAASETADRIAALPSVKATLIVRIANARIDRDGGAPIAATFEGVSGRSSRGAPITPPWTVLRGRDARGSNEVVVDAAIAKEANLDVGGTVTLRASCIADIEALPPAHLQVTGI